MDDVHDVSAESLALATLLHLGKRARQARDAVELGFIAVNETFQLTPYRQAALWLQGEGVAALSGVTAPEANASYVLWLNGLLQRFARDQQAATGPVILDATTLAAQEAEEWGEWLPTYGLWLPLPAAGALLLARDEPWSSHELVLLAEWGATWAHARAALSSGGRWWRPFKVSTEGAVPWFLRQRLLLWGVALALAGSLPVSLTVLAPAELVPLKPAVIRAPLDGVVDHVLVTPNQHVVEDEPLFEFDRANIQNRLQVAIKALATTQAEYRKTAQQAVFDPEGRAKLAVLQGQIAERDTEVAYLQKLNNRGMVTAPRAGVVLFDDPTEWIGRPVVTGERVMVVASEREVEVEAWLAPADVIALPADARVKLYLNSSPLTPVVARVRYVAHEAVQRSDGQFAYRLRATLEAGADSPRVGLKGTAKVEGESVSLAYWVMRRPLAAARVWLGV